MDKIQGQFAHRLRHLRIEAHLTQEQLALMVGMSAKYVSNLENGRGNPTLSNIVKLARGLAVTPSELLDGIDEDR